MTDAGLVSFDGRVAVISGLGAHARAGHGRILDVRNHFDRIRDVRDFKEHASAPDELDELRRMLEGDE